VSAILLHSSVLMPSSSSTLSGNIFDISHHDLRFLAAFKWWGFAIVIRPYVYLCGGFLLLVSVFWGFLSNTF